MTAPAPPPSVVGARARANLFGPLDPRLQASVAVPARDEAERLPTLLAALADQRDLGGRALPEGTVEVLVLLNNCTDESEAVLAEAAAQHPHLVVHAASVTLPPAEAHVGRARQTVMDAACARLGAVGRLGGVICSTDADTAPAPDWIAATLAEVSAGVDAVGGRALLLPDERAALAPGVRRLYLLDLAYRRVLEELRALYAPEPHDPVPRHHHHYGASLALTAQAYAAVGGVPDVRTSEDVALVEALSRGGWRLRHSPRVRVYTSARTSGRARGGLADAFVWWEREARAGRDPVVEAAADAERRLAALGLYRAASPETSPPPDLTTTPEPTPDAGEPIPEAIRGLRECVAGLRPLSLADRLDRASRLTRPPRPLAPAA